MHWLIVLALLASTTNLKNVGGSNDTLNRAAENALRQQIGSVRSLRVDAARRSAYQPGDFDYFNVALDGASLDNLLALADRTERNSLQAARLQNRQGVPLRNNLDIGDIFGGNGGDLGTILNGNGDLGGIFKGDIGQVLGGVLSGKGGRIGRVKLQLTNFSMQGVGYDRMDADLGEIRFDWVKALQGDFQIQSWQPGNLSLQLRADQAQRLIAPRLPSIRDPRLRFDNGRAWVGGTADLYGFRIPFDAGGRLSVQANQVRADDLALSVAKLRLPSIVVNELTKGVNPLYDFDPQKRWPIVVNLQTANAQNGTLSLAGGLEWVGFNRTNAPQNVPQGRAPQSQPRHQPSQPQYNPQYNPQYQPPYQAPQQPGYQPPDYVLN